MSLLSLCVAFSSGVRLCVWLRLWLFVCVLVRAYASEGFGSRSVQLSATRMATKDQLVEEVKQLQRSGPTAKYAWRAFCRSRLRGIMDPSRHEPSDLQDFLKGFRGHAAPADTGPPPAPAPLSGSPKEDQGAEGSWVPCKTEDPEPETAVAPTLLGGFTAWGPLGLRLVLVLAS